MKTAMLDSLLLAVNSCPGPPPGHSRRAAPQGEGGTIRDILDVQRAALTAQQETACSEAGQVKQLCSPSNALADLTGGAADILECPRAATQGAPDSESPQSPR